MGSITFVGMDVHKATVTAAVAEGVRGREVRQLGTFPNRAEPPVEPDPLDLERVPADRTRQRNKAGRAFAAPEVLTALIDDVHRRDPERTLAGLQAARALGRLGGRPPALVAKDLAAAKAMLQDPVATWPRWPSAWAWPPPPSTAICRGPVPRPWTPEPEPAHADQAGAALLLPDRLAADQPLGPVRAGRRQMPGLRAAAWRNRSAPGRWPVVG
jgi:hypothetical protein